jgi:acetyltransferase-like isoleucine patch superfamily enzyme
LGNGVMLDDQVTLLCTGPDDGITRIEIGSGSYINRQTFIDAAARISIGPKCLVGPFCYITDHDHDLDGAPGQLVSQPTHIEAECWLGAHVTVLKGVTIGTRSIIGAGSVVTKSIPPRSVAVGNPARVIRVRSDEKGDKRQ